MTDQSDPYDSAYPPSDTLPSDLKAFIKHYYKIVDSRDHAAYSKCFTEKGCLLAHGNDVQGRNALLKMHAGIWTGIEKRQHKPLRVFPFGATADSEGVQEVMIAGTVEYWNTDGTYGQKDMAVRATYEKDTDSKFGWAIGFLQVWLS